MHPLKLFLSVLLLFGTVEALTAQHACGTPHRSAAEMAAARAAVAPYMHTKSDGITYVPIKIHIIRPDNGDTSWEPTPEQLSIFMARASYELYGANMMFFTCGEPEYYNNSDLHIYPYFGNHGQQLIDNTNPDPTAMNMYFVETVADEDGNRFGGFAYFPWDNILGTVSVQAMDNGFNWINSPTIPHELGHNMNLGHTFDNTEDGPNGTFAENVARTGSQANCATAGDGFCDTTADPRGGTSNCAYTGNATDRFGVPYDPPIDNIMSYYGFCTDVFSPEQLAMMDATRQLRSNYNFVDLSCTGDLVTLPTDLEATRTGSTVTITWTDVANNETGYLVERATVDDPGAFITVEDGGVGPNAEVFVDPTALAGVDYIYRLRPLNGSPVTNGYSNQDCTNDNNCPQVATCPAGDTYTVTNTDDSGVGSLRAAIECVNNGTTITTIDFNVPGAGPHVIAPQTPLPALTRVELLIDGGATAGNIILDGSAAGPGANGLVIDAEIVDVRGLVIRNFSGAGVLFGNTANSGVSSCNLYGNGTGLIANGGEMYVNQCNIGVTESFADQGNLSHGIRVDLTNTLLVSNTNIGFNGGDGIHISDQPSYNFASIWIELFGVHIGGSTSYDAFPNAGRGIYAGRHAELLQVGPAFGASCVIANQDQGIYFANQTRQNEVFNVWMYCNDANIVKQSAAANDNVAPPVVTGATVNTVSGTATPGHRVGVYRAYLNEPCATSDCSGGDLIASVTADNNGNWQVSGFVFPIEVGETLSAIATNNDGSSSAFSECLVYVAPTCDDGVQNGDETGVDCGGSNCPACPDPLGDLMITDLTYDLADRTWTAEISNLGSFPVDFSNPVILQAYWNNTASANGQVGAMVDIATGLTELAPGQVIIRTVNSVTPNPGNFQLVLRVDDLLTVDETNESNNMTVLNLGFAQGCTDDNATNYDALALFDDGSCVSCDDGVQNGDETGVDCGGSCAPCSSCPTGTLVTVTTLADAGPGSLRQAILCANADANLDNIDFDLPGSAPFVINLQTPLPAVTDDGISISPAGFAGLPFGKIVVDGSALSGTEAGLRLNGDGISVEGIQVQNFPRHGVSVRGDGVTFGGVRSCAVLGNALDGLEAFGVADLTVRNTEVGFFDADDPSTGNGRTGINLTACEDFLIDNNIIGHNQGGGVYASGSFADLTNGVIINNLIGSYGDNDAFPNGDVGVLVGNNAQNVAVGQPGAENIIGYHPTGVALGGVAGNNAAYNTFECNATGVRADDNNFATPVITSWAGNAAAGTAAPGASVTVHALNDDFCGGFTTGCQGYVLLGSATANGSGDWQTTLDLSAAFFTVTEITAIVSSNSVTNGSEFSGCFTEGQVCTDDFTCADVVDVTLNENCQALLSIDEVIFGNLDCITLDDLVIDVFDGINDTNGPIVDGVGTHNYQVTCEGPNCAAGGFTTCFGSVTAAPGACDECADVTHTVSVNTEETLFCRGDLTQLAITLTVSGGTGPYTVAYGVPGLGTQTISHPGDGSTRFAIIPVNAAGTISVTSVTDQATGCASVGNAGAAFVAVTDGLNDPDFGCGAVTPFSLTVLWAENNGPGAAYTLSIDGGTPFPVSGGSYELTDLAPEQTVTATLTVSDEGPCPPLSFTVVCTTEEEPDPCLGVEFDVVNPDVILCEENGTLNLTSVDVLVAQNHPGAAVTWYADPTGQTPLASPTAYAPASAPFTVYVRLNDDGCVSEPQAVTLTFQSSAPPLITGLETTICATNDLYFLPGVSDNGISGDWIILGGALVTSINPNEYVGQTVQIVFYPTSNPCTQPYVHTLTVLPLVEPAFSGLVTEICATEETLDLPQTDDTGVPGYWSTNPEGSNTVSQTLDISTQAGRIKVYYFIPEASCGTPFRYEFVVGTPLDATFGVSADSVCLGEDLIVTHLAAPLPPAVGADAGAVPYAWSIAPAPDFTGGTDSVPIYRWNEPTEVTITLDLAADGCADSFTRTVTVYNCCEDVVVPQRTDLICTGTTYDWRGETYAAAGVYTASAPTPDGCDSLFTLELIASDGVRFVSCPADQEVLLNLGEETSVSAVWDAPVAEFPCGGAADFSGDTLVTGLTGDTTLVYAATSPGGQTAECSFTVRVLRTDDMTFFVDAANARRVDDTLMVPVGATDFGGASGFQFSLQLTDMDAAASFTGAVLPTGDMAGTDLVVNWVDAGTMNFVWTLDPTMPTALPDSLHLFEVGVVIAGEPGACARMDFRQTLPEAVIAFRGTSEVYASSRGGVVCSPTFADISGRVWFYGDEATEIPFGGATVTLASDGGEERSVTVAAAGDFTLPGALLGDAYRVGATFDGDVRAGVSILDALLIRNLLLGRPVSAVVSPYQILAADVANNDCQVDIFDLLAEIQLISGATPTFADAPSYRFVPAAHPLPTVEAIRDGDEGHCNAPESMRFDPLTDAVADADFVGFKMGDVDRNARPAVGGLSPVDLDDRTFRAGDVIDLTPRLAAGLVVADLNWWVDRSRLRPVATPTQPKQPYTASDFTDQRGSDLRQVWTDQTGALTLRFVAVADGSLRQALRLQPGSVGLTEEAVAYDLRLSGSAPAADLRLTARPNPFGSELTLRLRDADPAGGELTVLSATGQRMVQRRVVNPAGTLRLTTTDWPAGVYLVRYADGGGERVLKLVRR